MPLFLVNGREMCKLSDSHKIIIGANKYLRKNASNVSLKTDSFVVETNVHFPTDYNLLWDCSRKALDTIKWFKKKHPTLQGWRKSDDWFKSLKNLSRAMGKVSASSGKNKTLYDYRIPCICSKYFISS